jgi:hypothetical protein
MKLTQSSRSPERALLMVWRISPALHIFLDGFGSENLFGARVAIKNSHIRCKLHSMRRTQDSIHFFHLAALDAILEVFIASKKPMLVCFA